MNHSFTTRYFKRILLLAGMFCCLCFYATAQTATQPATKPATKLAVKTSSTAPKTLQTILDGFFKRYKDSTGEAIDYIFATNRYFTNSSGIATLKKKLDSLRLTLGDYVGHEVISQKNASASLVLYTYLVKHEIQPVRFTFMFYKPHNDWLLYRFKYDDQMDTELEQAGKINNKAPRP